MRDGTLVRVGRGPTATRLHVQREGTGEPLLWITGFAISSEIFSPVIDSYAALCPNGYQPLLGNDPLYEDGLHFTNESAPHVWAWMMPQVLRFADTANGEAS